MKKKKFNFKKLLKVTLIVLALFFFVLHPLGTVISYECIFSTDYEVKEWLQIDIKELSGLRVERSDFQSGEKLAGYKYSREGENVKGVIVIAHGMGNGGHNKLLTYINEFTKNGYLVFAYEAEGHDKSGGDGVGGFPQGIEDLDNAIRHVKKEYKGLPIMLFGHSWGAYSIGNVLNIHTDIKAAVMVSGFNESSDLLKAHARPYGGFLVDLLVPYVTLYENIKFGSDYASVSAVEGIEKTSTPVLIVHSKDDPTVPVESGYEEYYECFKNDSSVDFLLYEDRGHSALLYSEAAVRYQDKLQRDYEAYLEKTGKDDTDEVKGAYMKGRLDPVRYYEPNMEIVNRALELFDKEALK